MAVWKVEKARLREKKHAFAWAVSTRPAEAQVCPGLTLVISVL